MIMVNGDLMQTDDMLIQEGISTSLEDVKYGAMKTVAFQVIWRNVYKDNDETNTDLSGTVC
jgi:hypothetical protein